MKINHLSKNKIICPIVLLTLALGCKDQNVDDSSNVNFISQERERENPFAKSTRTTMGAIKFVKKLGGQQIALRTMINCRNPMSFQDAKKEFAKGSISKIRNADYFLNTNHHRLDCTFHLFDDSNEPVLFDERAWLQFISESKLNILRMCELRKDLGCHSSPQLHPLLEAIFTTDDQVSPGLIPKGWNASFIGRFQELTAETFSKSKGKLDGQVYPIRALY